MSAVWCQRIVPAISAAALALAAGVTVAAGNDKEEGGTFHARLTGFQEVPSVSTVARGEFKGKLDPRTGFIDYEFSYEGLQGKARQAHIHFGQRSVNGVIVVWLCQTSFNTAPAGLNPQPPTCGEQAGSFTGVINASSVIVAPPQGSTVHPQQLSTGELAELIKAIRAGVAYVNVHTDISPGGEIRGQLRHRP